MNFYKLIIGGFSFMLNLFNSYYSSGVNYLFELAEDDNNNLYIYDLNGGEFLLKKTIFLDFDNSEDI